MSKKKINILKDLLNEEPYLLEFSFRDNEYNKWRARVVSTLESLFGKNSRQYSIFSIKIRSYKQHATDQERQAAYCRDIQLDIHSLEAIIAGLEQEEKVKDAFKFERTLKAISNWFYSKLNSVWQWIKTHKILSVIFPFLILALTLLGTNWDIAERNWNNFINFLRSTF